MISMICHGSHVFLACGLFVSVFSSVVILAALKLGGGKRN